MPIKKIQKNIFCSLRQNLLIKSTGCFCGKDRKGADGVRKIGGLKAADFPNGALLRETLDSLVFAVAERSGAGQKAARKKY